MYAYIRGIVTEKGAAHVVVEAGGIGYLLMCSARTLNTISPGDEARLLTHFHVTEDSMTLYGFSSSAEREMFQKLLAVSKVGPKVALAVLSSLSPEDLALAIVTGNEDMFGGVSGVGKKTAARIILEMRGKVDSLQTAAPDMMGDMAAEGDIRAEAIAALMSLGYDGKTATLAVANAKERDTLPELIRSALREAGSLRG